MRTNIRFLHNEATFYKNKHTKKSANILTDFSLNFFL
jgi:hypothetical protein